MLLSIILGEALYVAHRLRRVIVASPLVLACAFAAMAAAHHWPAAAAHAADHADNHPPALKVAAPARARPAMLQRVANRPAPAPQITKS